jgi:hypothetical protein
MTEQQYKQQLTDLQTEYDNRKRELMGTYAFANNPYKAGDVFTDHIGSIKIERIRPALSGVELPCCVYTGLILKKDGTPTKKMESRSAWQTNEVPNAQVSDTRDDK